MRYALSSRFAVIENSEPYAKYKHWQKIEYRDEASARCRPGIIATSGQEREDWIDELQALADREEQSPRCYGERLVMLAALRDFAQNRLLENTTRYARHSELESLALRHNISNCGHFIRGWTFRDRHRAEYQHSILDVIVAVPSQRTRKRDNVFYRVTKLNQRIVKKVNNLPHDRRPFHAGMAPIKQGAGIWNHLQIPAIEDKERPV